ncbi:MAG: Eco57I restriction-modification methylase domain-containing protein, partial [Dehalococcoidia bacterium]
MDHQLLHVLDLELDPQDIQALNGSDAVAAFFARLGYNTDVRTHQTPGNLGITAEGTSRPIKKVELLADQETLFQVYLFELTNVTMSHTRALARSFRNLAGNYLLVLTSDYERLDFVLLEKELPARKDQGPTIAQRQVVVRPRILTVERRKPSRVHLRVLRRLTWTESDPFAQYDKLLSAYAVADWSEECFNNRALFSDYYLLERLPALPAWTEDPKPAYRRLRELYQGAITRFAGKDAQVLREELLEPALQVLEFEVYPGKKSTRTTAEPDYCLGSQHTASSPLALCLAYPWGRSLDGKDDQRDRERPEENPGAVVVSLLEKGEAPWVLVTNGKIWRLYAQRAHSRATNYYEIDLEEVLAQAGPLSADPATSFRYFWLLFRCRAFEPVTVEREGKEQALSFLDQLLLESEDYAKELGERLKERVFEDVFPHLATGFITYLQGHDGHHTDLSQPTLNAVSQGTLTLLYRLLFLLYVEARDLLPVKETRGYFEVSLMKLKREVAEAAGSIADDVDRQLKKHYRKDRHELYDRLMSLFHIVDRGNPALNVPVYNGGLFFSYPEEQDESPEAQAARFLQRTKVSDHSLARALDLLARDVDQKRQDLVPIDFKSLGVRQLGSIYEGLLEFRLRVAPEKMAIVKGKKTEEIVPYGEAKRQQRAILTHGRGQEAKERVLPKGTVYLENDKRERKATGSYYTPDHIVKYIVEHAVGPVLQEKFEAMRSKLREVQQKRRAFFQKQEALRKQHMRPEPESKADLIGQELVDELFDLKVLDPAMGSGHFLVEAVDYITDKALNFLNAFPWNPVVAFLTRMRQTILQEMDTQGITIDTRRLSDVNLLKRHVLKRCIYGVDLNPMAVELAKVSLWLDCFTLGAPLSFLDHHLRCGNSLIGVTVKEVQKAVEPVTRISSKSKTAESAMEWKEVKKIQHQFNLFGSRFAGLLLATDLMRHVGDLSDVTSDQVQESRAEYRRATDALAPFKRILDVYTSQWFGNGGKKKGRGKKDSPAETPALAFLKNPKAESFLNARDKHTLEQALTDLPAEERQVAETALAEANEKRFFHWELEFPEVFY